MLTSLLLLVLSQGLQELPGLIEIPAGRIYLGAELNRAKELIAQKPNSAQWLGAEVGREKKDVERFFISPTEVTNEMYFHFVKDTGAMPPASWTQFTKEQRLAIIKEGKEKDRAFVFSDYVKSAWWEKHWEEGNVKWELLDHQALLPVTFMSHEDAITYCIWAGLRLPTEEEWVRAARSDSELEYPYGENFDATLTAFEATKPKQLAFKALPVSGLPGNKSSFGCFDMSGNVWEWTDSNFSAFPKFKSFKVKTEDGMTIDVVPEFDASSAILKGGSYQNADFNSRIDTRLGIPRNIRAPHIGFRVASSATPLWNHGWYSARNLPGSLLDGMAERTLSFDNILGFEKHRTVSSDLLSKSREDVEKPLPAPNLPESYIVFDRYDALGIIPSKSLDFQNIKKIETVIAQKGPLPVGALVSTVALEEANILPGTYVLLFCPRLETEFILELGATVPVKFMPEELPESKEYEDHKKDPLTFWPTMAGIEIEPDQEYLLVVDSKKEVKGAIRLLKTPKLERIKQAPHQIAINLKTQHLDFTFRVEGPRGKAWVFSVGLKPRNQDGALVNEGYWDGSFDVIPAEQD
jgi:sulfatase modifying factor 1